MDLGRRGDIKTGFCAFSVCCAAILIGLTRSHAIQVADSGELTSVACALGVAHPPGYPLYTLIGHLFCQLPWDTPAGRLALFSMLCGMWTVFNVYWICFRLTSNVSAAAFASIWLCIDPLVWRYASLPEVFSLHLALCTTFVLHCLRVGERQKQPSKNTVVLGLLFGLAMSNHLSSIFVLPTLLLTGTWRSLERVQLAAAALFAFGCALGLSPYLYLRFGYLANIPSWGAIDSWAGVWNHMLRKDYGVFQLAMNNTGTSRGALKLFGNTVFQRTDSLFLIFAMIGVLYPFIRRRAQERSLLRQLHSAQVIALMLLLSGPLFFIGFNIETQDVGRQVVERFFLLPLVWTSLLVAVGLSLAMQWVAAYRWGPITMHFACGLVLLCSAFIHIGQADVSDHFAVEDYANNALRSAPPHSVIFGTGDVRLFSFMYAQEIMKRRRDVLYVDVRMLLHRWYVKQLKKTDPSFTYQFTEHRVDSIQLIASLLAQRRPVLLANIYHPRVRRSFSGYPWGPMFRILDHGERPKTPSDVFQTNLAIYRRFERRGRREHLQHDRWSTMLTEAFGQTWQTIGRALSNQDDHQRARYAYAQATYWAPWIGRK